MKGCHWKQLRKYCYDPPRQYTYESKKIPLVVEYNRNNCCDRATNTGQLSQTLTRNATCPDNCVTEVLTAIH